MTTFYAQQVAILHRQLYPKAQLLQQVMQAKKYMDSHYAEPINLQHIAGKAFYSKFHFIRIFRQVYGRTPGSYLTSVRMQRAALLLQAGSTVADACYSVGYSSIHTFSTLFRRSKGTTPAAYRKQKHTVTTRLSK